MSNNRKSKGDSVAAAKQLIAGAEKRLSKTAPAVFAGGSFTADQITSKLQRLVDLRTDVNVAAATAKAKVFAEGTESPALLAFMRELRAFLKVTFSTSPDVLADFGITPKSRAIVSAEATLAAVAKRKATRAARHTMGTKQKKGIKGDVTGVVVVPVTPSAPHVTVTSPSTPATSGGTTATPPRTA